MPPTNRNAKTEEEVKDANLNKPQDGKEEVKETTQESPKETVTDKAPLADGKTAETKDKQPEDGKDAQIAELKKQLANSQAENGKKDELIKEQRATIATHNDDKLNNLDVKKGNDENIATAEVSDKKDELYPVQFLKDHSFTMGTTDVKALKGQTKEVDIFTVRKLTARGIAVQVSK